MLTITQNICFHCKAEMGAKFSSPSGLCVKHIKIFPIFFRRFTGSSKKNHVYYVWLLHQLRLFLPLGPFICEPGLTCLSPSLAPHAPHLFPAPVQPGRELGSTQPGCIFCEGALLSTIFFKVYQGILVKFCITIF